MKAPPFENVIQYSGEFLNLLLPPILRYMGDYPHHARNPIELTDQIFGPATQHDALKDEIYCQIMRQMTGNSNRWIPSQHTVLHDDLHPSPQRLLYSHDNRVTQTLTKGCRMCNYVGVDVHCASSLD